MRIDPRSVQAGTYKGKIETLRGKRALLRPSPERDLEMDRPRFWLAQFDERELMLGDKRIDCGWHQFPYDAFDVDLAFNAVD